MRYLQYSMTTFFSTLAWFFKELVEVRSFFDLSALFTELFAKLIALMTVVHYGCPNSNRTKRLQLKKILFR